MCLFMIIYFICKGSKVQPSTIRFEESFEGHNFLYYVQIFKLSVFKKEPKCIGLICFSEVVRSRFTFTKLWKFSKRNY